MSFELIEGPLPKKITRTLAEHFRDMPACERDRPLSDRRLAFLAKEAKEERLRPPEWASAYCVEDKTEYRVNGKHTSTLLSGTDINANGHYVVVSKYKCQTREDVASLYATFDSKKSARTNRDINLVFAGSLPELQDVVSTTIHLASSGMAFAKWEAAEGARSAEERAALLLEHPEFVLWLHHMVGKGSEGVGRDRDILRRKPVAAAMFKTWMKSRPQSEAFWNAVRDASDASNKNPSRTLNKYLLTIGVRTGRGMMRTRTAPPREIMCKSVTAWNAFRRGETTNLNYFPDARTPAAV